jgi:hypothetical protein
MVVTQPAVKWLLPHPVTRHFFQMWWGETAVISDSCGSGAPPGILAATRNHVWKLPCIRRKMLYSVTGYRRSNRTHTRRNTSSRGQVTRSSAAHVQCQSLWEATYSSSVLEMHYSDIFTEANVSRFLWRHPLSYLIGWNREKPLLNVLRKCRWKSLSVSKLLLLPTVSYLWNFWSEEF